MPTPFRYATPVSRRSASGVVAGVYAQLAADLGRVAEPYMAMSPAPEVMAATWALLRESQLVGRAARADKELVATAVSQANRCPFCVDAHAVFIHAAGAHRLAEAAWGGQAPTDPTHARLVAWARATRTPGAPELAAPPFPPEVAAEFIGTVLGYHFINRMVSALLTDSPLPGRLGRSRLVRRVGGWAFARTLRRPRRPGDSLRLLGDLPAGGPPAWAGDTPIGTAVAALRASTAGGSALLTSPARALVRRTVADWDGQHPPMTGGWPQQPLATLPAADRPAARLTLLAALAPYRITDADVTAWRTTRPGDADANGDADLVRLLASGAMTAVNHLEAAITAARQPARG